MPAQYRYITVSISYWHRLHSMWSRVYEMVQWRAVPNILFVFGPNSVFVIGQKYSKSRQNTNNRSW